MTFSVSASGDGLTYQWQVSTNAGATFTDIAGATGATYTVSAAAASLNGAQYRVVVKGTAGAGVTSSPVNLTVAAAVAAPAVTVDLAPVTVTAGSDATFSVTATGTSLSYQWQTSNGGDFTAVPGATGSTLTLPAVAAADDGKSVRVVVTNSAGSVTSGSVFLTVTQPAIATAPAISAQPSAVSVTAPASATFAVSASGSPAPGYQWQKSTDGGSTYADIPGATAARYATPATALADSGSRFRVNVTNSAGTTTSAAATLTVAAAASAPGIATQPASASVFIPNAVTFSVVATGVPTPTYQWQLSTDGGTSWSNITGATSASYKTAATVIEDNGKRYRVVASNSAGSVTSAPAVLTASRPASVLADRAWTTGQSLETNDNTVLQSAVGIDNAGNAISVFTKSNGTRTALYAVRGVPGAAGTAPLWSAPVAVDSAGSPIYAGTSSVTPNWATTVAPNGNAAITWVSQAPCTASTYTPTLTSTCNYLFTATYSVTTNTWSAPVKLADTPDNTPSLIQRLNSRGDLALLYPGWVRGSTATSYTGRTAVLWLPAGSATVQSKVFDDATLTLGGLGQDKDGNMVVAGEAKQNATTDIVAYRGTLAAGFRAQEVLDQRTAAAAFGKLTVGVNGQAMVTWSQNNGTQSTIFSADITTPTGNWSVKELGADTGTAFSTDYLVIDDAGQAVFARVLNGGCSPYFYRYTGSAWSTKQSFASGFATYSCNGSVAVNRNGDLLVFQNGSFWTSYDGRTNTIVRANSTGSTTVYGTTSGNNSFGTRSVALSVSGVAVATAAVAFDTLPTVAQPAGDGRSSVVNLWGFFLK